jgi:hypothetical protein
VLKAQTATGDISQIFGLLKSESKKKLTLDEIEAAISDGWANKR